MWPSPPEGPNVQEVKNGLADRNKQRDAAVAMRSAMLAGPSCLAASRKAIEDKIASLTSVRAEGEKEARLEREALELEMSQLAPLSMAEEKALKVDIQAIPDGQSETQAIEQKIAVEREKIAVLTRLGAECPTCRQKIAKQKITEITNSLAGYIQNLEGKLANSRELDRLRDKGLQAKAKIEASWSEQVRKEEIEKELVELGNTDGSQIDTELKKAQEELDALPATAEVPDTTEIDAQIADLDSRIARGQEILAGATAAVESRRAYEAFKKRKANLEADVKMAEACLQFAGPDGARKTATGNKLGPFVESLNAAMQAYGFLVAFTIEPYLMRVNKGGLVKLHLRQLSMSERFRFSTAFQIALAKVTGVDLAVIDFADMLTEDKRLQLLEMVVGEIGQVIICSTSTSAAPPPEKIPEGIRFFQLESSNDVTIVA